jgi:KUP system potassium uptake protein
MNKDQVNLGVKRLSLAGIIITLGIVFGDLGTIPLYTMNAILRSGADNFSELLIFGTLSCIFWTLTLSTTVKYVLVAIRADNNGEGGIFALITLIKDKSQWIAILTMIGGAALLADGVLTPAVALTSSVEGLRLYNPDIHVVPIVVIILAILFFVQQFGTGLIKKSFGPVMVVWFLILAIMGLSQLIRHPDILRAINPEFAFRFLKEYPGGFIMLGAVFLCTTGAEAIYAELGRSGRPNIRISWTFIKITLILSYFGQGAWLMMNINQDVYLNPFFEMMPKWFLVPGIIMATAAAIVASQAIITGSYTLLSEAVSLNFWPKVRILHPSFHREEVYLPFVNWFLWVSCTFTVIFFKESVNMTAAYGLSINIAEIMITLLLFYYLFQKGVNHRLILLLLMIFITVEGAFLIANLNKLTSGGWFTILIASVCFIVMFGWYFGRKLKNRYITFANLDNYLSIFKDLSKDESVPKFATNLVYLIRANKLDQVESKVIYSIFHKQPKRADTYWFIHVDRVNEPNRFNYKVTQIIPGILIRVDFYLGFKIAPKVNLYFKEVLEDLVKSGEVKVNSSFSSMKKYNIEGDFKFILIDRIMSRDFSLSTWENFILTLHNIVRVIGITDIRSLNLDSTITIEEKVPIIIDQPVNRRIQRIGEDSSDGLLP